MNNGEADLPLGPHCEVLVLCTANQCRSPMAEVLLRDRLAARGVDAVVSSAGELPGGVPASVGSVRAMATRGLDLGSHSSRTLNPELLDRSDLVVAMARRHLRTAVVTRPSAFPKTFTLKELVRRASAVGPRRAEQPLADWLDAVHAGRTASGLMGEDLGDDVADPIGGPDRLYEETAVELAGLVDRLVDLAFAAATERETA